MKALVTQPDSRRSIDGVWPEFFYQLLANPTLIFGVFFTLLLDFLANKRFVYSGNKPREEAMGNF